MFCKRPKENPEAALNELVCAPDADLIVNAISGSAGLMPTFAAVKAGKRIALANKESLVMVGELIMELAKKPELKFCRLIRR